MTLALTIQGRTSIWAAADCRLSYQFRLPFDESIKIADIGATDGRIILTYAGLGATAAGSVISDWVRLALRGQVGTVEETLAAIAGLGADQFGRHLASLSGAGNHVFLAACFVAGQVRLYTIGLELVRHTLAVRPTLTRQIALRDRPPAVAFAGSGAPFASKDRTRSRQLLRLVTEFERNRLSPGFVAVAIADLIHGVHTATQSVGPNSIVVWRMAEGGGAQKCFRNGRDSDCWGMIPTISGGMDISGLLSIVTPGMIDRLTRQMNGEEVAEISADEHNEELALHDWSNRPELK